MVKVQCIKCSREGSLVKKQTKSKGLSYVYWYVEHHIGNKIKWCYLGKYEKLPEEYKSLIHKDTQTDTQNMHKSDKPRLASNNQKNPERDTYLNWCFSQKFDAYKNFFGHTDSHDSPHNPFFSVNINETFVNA